MKGVYVFSAFLTLVVVVIISSVDARVKEGREAETKIEAARVEARNKSIGRPKHWTYLKSGEVFTVMAVIEEERGLFAAIIMPTEGDGRPIFVDGLGGDPKVGNRLIKTEASIMVIK